MVTLQYIHDPLCGWCYAAAPLDIAIAADNAGILVSEAKFGILSAVIGPRVVDASAGGRRSVSR